MRINPYQYNFIQISKNPNLIVLNRNSKSLQLDSPQISFQGDQEPAQGVEPFSLKNYQHISGIHCPVCSTKMLSKEEYANIIEIAGNIEDGNDFLGLLNRYKDYIPPNMRLILDTPVEFVNDSASETATSEFVSDESKQPITDIRAFYLNARNNAYNNHVPSVNSAKEFLRNYASSLEDKNLQNDFLEAIESITDIDSFYVFKSKISKLVERIPFPNNREKHFFYLSFAPKIIDSSNYLGVFRGGFKYKEMSNAEISKELVKRLFNFSVQHESPISKFDKFQDMDGNSVLLCNRCDGQSSRQSFLPGHHEILNDIDLKENFKVYISDIAYLMGRGEFDKYTSYLSTFLYLASKVSSDNIKFDDYFKSRLSALVNSASRHDDFEPLVQENVDIPCASCDSTLMPHSVKCRLEKDLSKCNTLQDYCDVVKKYEKYVGEYSRDLALEFLNTAQDYPEATDKEFVEILRKKMIPYYKYETNVILDRMKKGLRYHIDNKNNHYIPYFEKAIDNFEKYIKEGKFEDFEFYKMHDECFSEMLDEHTPSSLRGLFTNLRVLSYKNSLSKTEDRNAQSDKDDFYTIVYNIFKPSVATVDHLVAMSRDGTSDKYNYIGLCKPCNSILKSKSNIYHWHQRVYGVRKHMHKQLEVIDKMAKEGKLEGYDDWASVIAQKMYEGTFGKYDLRHRFDQQV